MALVPATWYARCDTCEKELRGSDDLDVQGVLAAVLQLGWEFSLRGSGKTELRCAECATE